ncbi:hypothetical protein KI387_029875, partial [Taxus chinensis]
MQAINENIVFVDYGEYKAEIKTMDSQESFNHGVLILAINAPPAEVVEELAPIQELHEAKEQAPQLDKGLHVKEEHVFPLEHEEGSSAKEEASSLKTVEVVQNEQPVIADISVMPHEDALKNPMHQ